MLDELGDLVLVAEANTCGDDFVGRVFGQEGARGRTHDIHSQQLALDDTPTCSSRGNRKVDVPVLRLRHIHA